MSKSEPRPPRMSLNPRERRDYYVIGYFRLPERETLQNSYSNEFRNITGSFNLQYPQLKNWAPNLKWNYTGNHRSKVLVGRDAEFAQVVAEAYKKVGLVFVQVEEKYTRFTSRSI